jgi:purine-binding chemotaxis protein CheW
MLNLFSPRKRLFDTSTTQEGLRAIIFAVMDYWFALPIEAVLKIVPYPSINNLIKDGISIIDWENQTVTVVDLRYKLGHLEQKGEIEKTCGLQRFLVMIMTQAGEICGLLVEQSPNLIDIPYHAIRPVPPSYRQVTQLNFVRQMAVLPGTESEKPLKVFLIGV